jgi:drug/metabolite transporter (DMT)-like permease
VPLTKIVLTFIAMISFTVLANLLLKTGATLANPGQGAFQHLLNWRVFLGLCSFGLAACFYVLVLQWLPLNVAQSFAAAQFVAVILASALVLSEPIGPPQWLGITLIALGIAVVGWSRQ